MQSIAVEYQAENVSVELEKDEDVFRWQTFDVLAKELWKRGIVFDSKLHLAYCVYNGNHVTYNELETGDTASMLPEGTLTFKRRLPDGADCALCRLEGHVCTRRGRPCARCHAIFPRSGFSKYQWKKPSSVCTKCVEALSTEAATTSRQCSSCQNVSPRSAFSSSQWKKASSASVCKTCAGGTKDPAVPSTREKQPQGASVDPRERPCSRCRTFFPSSGFSTTQWKKRPRSSVCTQCVTVSDKKPCSPTPRPAFTSSARARARASPQDEVPLGRRPYDESADGSGWEVVSHHRTRSQREPQSHKEPSALGEAPLPKETSPPAGANARANVNPPENTDLEEIENRESNERRASQLDRIEESRESNERRASQLDRIEALLLDQARALQQQIAANSELLEAVNELKMHEGTT